VRQIVEATYGTDVSLEVFISEELERKPPCESTVHAEGAMGHNAEQAAAWIMIPSCSHDKLLCDSWKRHATNGYYTQFTCNECLAITPVPSLIFVSLDI
jgi:hypothetical protein